MKNVPPISQLKLTAFDLQVHEFTQSMVDEFKGDQQCIPELKDSKYKLYKTALEETHMGRCAFCELKIADGYAAVEHYRPKRGPLKNNDKTITEIPNPFNAASAKIAHPGYFWLAYNGDNLLYACTTCNTPKSNHFPVMHTRAGPPANLPGTLGLASEGAVILNPTIDSVEDHIELLPNFHLSGLTERGKHTIDILKLNRDSLLERREIAFNKARESYAKFLDAGTNAVRYGDEAAKLIRDATLKELDSILARETECSLAALYGFHFAHTKYKEHLAYLEP